VVILNQDDIFARNFAQQFYNEAPSEAYGRNQKELWVPVWVTSRVWVWVSHYVTEIHANTESYVTLPIGQLAWRLNVHCKAVITTAALLRYKKEKGCILIHWSNWLRRGI